MPDGAGTYNATIAQIKCIDLPASKPCDIKQSPAGVPAVLYTEYGWPTLAWPAQSAPSAGPTGLAYGFRPRRVLAVGHFGQ